MQVQERFDGVHQWQTGTSDDTRVEETVGRLVIATTKGHSFYTSAFISMWGGTDGRDYSIDMGGGQIDWLQLGNVDMTFEASVERDTGTAQYGVACRFQDDANFYGILIESRGYYAIGKTVNNKNTTLASGKSSAIHAGLATNAFHVTCSGDQLTLAVNNTHLATVADSALKTGIVALIGGAEEDPADTVVSFDNLVIRAP